MPAALLIALIQAATATVKALAPVAQTVLTNVNSNDAASIKAALNELQAEGDALHLEVQAKLRG